MLWAMMARRDKTRGRTRTIVDGFRGRWTTTMRDGRRVRDRSMHTQERKIVEGGGGTRTMRKRVTTRVGMMVEITREEMIMEE